MWKDQTEKLVLVCLPKLAWVLILAVISSALGGLFTLKSDRTELSALKEVVMEQKVTLKETIDCVRRIETGQSRFEAVLERVEKRLDK